MDRLLEPIEHDRQAIEKRAEHHFKGKIEGQYVAHLPRGLIHAEGTHQVVIKLPTPQGQTEYVIKVVKDTDIPPNEQFVTTNRQDVKNALQQETNALIFRKLGYRVVPHVAVWLDEPKIAVVAAPDMTTEGNRVEEAHGFDFSRLKNGQEVRQEFDRNVKTLLEMNEKGHIQPDGHITKDGPRLAFEKLFHVVLPKPKILGGRLDGLLNFFGRWFPGWSQKPNGALVIGDLDHTSFKGTFLSQVRFHDVNERILSLALAFQDKKEPGSV